MIRHAKLSDRIALVGLGQRFLRQSELPLEINAVWIEQTVKRAIADPNWLALVLDVDGVKGGLVAALDQTPLSPSCVAQEVAFFIAPKHRGPWAQEFVTSFEHWARAKGAVVAFMSVLDPRTARVFGRYGYAQTETKMLKVL